MASDDTSTPIRLPAGYLAPPTTSLRRAAWMNIVSPGTRPPLDAARGAIFESGHQSGEFELLTPDGSPRKLVFRKQAYDLLAGALGEVDVGLHVVDEQQWIGLVYPAGPAMLRDGPAEELLGLPVQETIRYRHPKGSAFPADECGHLAVLVTGEGIDPAVRGKTDHRDPRYK